MISESQAVKAQHTILLGAILLGACLMVGCKPAGPEDSGEFQAYWEARDRGEFADAVVLARRLQEAFPETAFGWGCVGEAHKNLGDMDEAIAAYQKAFELDPADARMWINLGWALAEQGQLDEAIAAYQKTIELYPNLAMAWNNLGGALLEQGKPDEAITALRKATELDPAYAMAWGNLGRALLNLGQGDEAITASRKAIELDPGIAASWINLGWVLSEQGQLDEAIAALRHVLEVEPENPNAIQNLAVAYARAGQIDRSGIWMARYVLMVGSRMGVTDEATIVREFARGLRELKIEIPMDPPSEEAVKDYYEAHKEAFSDTAVHLQMISGPKVSKTQEFMDTLREDLASGGDFAEAARSHSDDSAASKGGDRDWVKRGDLREDLADAAFALKVGEISGVLEDRIHYRILSVVERRDGTPAPLSEVKEQIVETMKKTAREAQIRQWIAEARRELTEARGDS